MLSAKAIVNFTLLTIIVPRIIRASMTSRSIQGSEIRSNYQCAQISILISVIGVLAVAIAFRFWMLLAGEFIRCHHPSRTSFEYGCFTNLISTGSLCPGFSSSSIHNVPREISFDRHARIRHPRLQHRHAYQDTWFSCRSTLYGISLGSGYTNWRCRFRAALFYFCGRSSARQSQWTMPTRLTKLGRLCILPLCLWLPY